MGLDDVHLLVPEDRADVRLALVGLLQGLGLRDHLLDEGLVDRLGDVDALRPAAVMPGVEAGSAHRAFRRAVEIRITADDHRVLAAELERDRNQIATTRLTDLAAGRDAAGERDLVDARFDQRRAGLAVALDDLVEVLGKARRDRQLVEQHRRERRHLARLVDHRIARHQRLRERICCQRDGTVPGRDQSDDAEGLIGQRQLLREPHHTGRPAMNGLQIAGRALRVVRDLHAGRQHFHGDRFVARLARLLDHERDDVVLARDDLVDETPENLRPFRKGSRRPFMLGLPGPGHGRSDLVCRSAVELPDRFEGDGALDVVAAAAVARGNRFE